MKSEIKVPSRVAIIAAYVFSLKPLTSNKEMTVNKIILIPHIHNKLCLMVFR